eukprot:scaffold50790_cov25-Tisochrysis_lutea.AAC.1
MLSNQTHSVNLAARTGHPCWLRIKSVGCTKGKYLSRSIPQKKKSDGLNQGMPWLKRHNPFGRKDH